MTYVLHTNNSKDTVTLYPPGDNGSALAQAHWIDSGYDSAADTDGSWTADDGDTEWYGAIGALKHATRDLPARDAIWEFLDRSFANG